MHDDVAEGRSDSRVVTSGRPDVFLHVIIEIDLIAADCRKASRRTAPPQLKKMPGTPPAS
jgi:hypothetical protein